MSAHTPGPWLVQAGDEWADGIVTLEGHNENGTPMYWTVASYNRRRDEADANARLIASAPDLLEALRVVVAAWDNGDWLSVPIRAARAAIVKATGEAA